MHRRRVVVDFITYVGLDVHKDGIAVALAESGIRGEVREYGRIANTAAAINRLLRKLGDAGRLRFCYEAVPSGAWARVRCGWSVADLKDVRAIGSRPIGAMPPAWQGCIGLAS
jgi:hypothetical protein